jgi:hypothetical protein
MRAENVLLYFGRLPWQTVFRTPHFGYIWDGMQITTVYEKKLYANY